MVVWGIKSHMTKKEKPNHVFLTTFSGLQIRFKLWELNQKIPDTVTGPLGIFIMRIAYIGEILNLLKELI